MLCVFGRDIDRQKFSKYVWDYLFQKSNVGGSENLIVSNISDRNKLAVDVFHKCERAKK
jgi:outer membrane protein assembly factor BamE (lipoprotein component of BamABCDE complex)